MKWGSAFQYGLAQAVGALTNSVIKKKLSLLIGEIGKGVSFQSAIEKNNFFSSLERLVLTEGYKKNLIYKLGEYLDAMRSTMSMTATIIAQVLRVVFYVLIVALWVFAAMAIFTADRVSRI